MTTRRQFLTALAAAMVLDPEKALWRPGTKLISIPAALPDSLKLGIEWERYIRLNGKAFFIDYGGIFCTSGNQISVISADLAGASAMLASLKMAGYEVHL